MSKKWKIRVLLILILFGITTLAYLNRNFLLQKYYIKYTSYNEFGIKIPTQYPTHGIDVSRYQGIINWEMVAAMNVNGIKIEFVFIKATEGVNYKDPKFNYNWKYSKKNNIIRGAYHYFKPNLDAKLQTNNYLKNVKFEKGDIVPVIDIEETSGMKKSQIISRLKEWVDIVEKKLKVKPIIYTYHDFYKQYLKGNFDNYPLWIAHYGVSTSTPDNKTWNFWQHSDRGKVNGINTKVDFNVFNREIEKLKHYQF